MNPSAAQIRLWREDRGILRFVSDNFRVQLDPWQEKALLLIASPRPEDQRVSLQACAGPGKSAVLAWGGWWFLSVQGDEHEHPKGAVTAITGDNLKDNLWAEYAKWQNVSPYLSYAFTWTASRIFANDHTETWFLSARSWPKSANADQQGATLSGMHSPYVMAQVDESGAVPTTVLRAAEQALTTAKFGKLVQAGNPISLDGMLHAAFTVLRHQWQVIIVTGDPDDPDAWVHSPRVGEKPLAWAKQQIETYGRDNPWVMSYILGKFPPGSINALLSAEEVEAAMKRVVKPEQYNWNQKRLGVDVARFGDDRTVIAKRQGMKAFTPIIMRNAMTSDIAARVAEARIRWSRYEGGDPLILIDDTGHWGHGVIDQLLISGHSVHPVVFHAKANHPRYKNRRAEMHLKLADWVKRGGSLPFIPELVGELTAMTYTFFNGTFQLEDKDQVKAKIGRSPDIADAYALTFAVEDMPNEMAQHLVKPQRATTMDMVDEMDSRARERWLDIDSRPGRAATLDDEEAI